MEMKVTEVQEVKIGRDLFVAKAFLVNCTTMIAG